MSLLRLFNNSELDQNNFPYQNFNEILKKHAENHSSFLRFFDSGKLKNELSFSQFYFLVQDLSLKILENFAIQEGTHVAVAMDNSPEALIAFAAVMNLNLVLIPIDPQQSEEYYKKVSAQFDCEFLIAPEGHISGNAFKNVYSYLVSENNPTTDFTPKKFQKDPSVVIFASSGTTGTPKGIVQSFHSILVNSLAIIKTQALNKDSKHFCVLPLFHGNAFSFSFFTSLINGNELILNRNFSQSNFWETVNLTSPQIISLIPPIIRLLTEDPRVFIPNKSIRYVTSAASNLGKKTLTDFYQKFNIPVIQAYGLSETVNFSTTFPPFFDKETYEDIIASDEKTSIGVEIWGNNLFLLDENREIILTEKTEGEIVMRGWNMLNEYYHSQVATAETFKNDFFHSGDIGYFRIFNNQKFYYISGRKREIAKVNGKMIFLNEIDEMLMSLSYISNVCSVCYLDDNNEEQLGIYISLREADSPLVLEIKNDFKKMLPRNLFPKKILIGNDIRLTPSGKKRRSEMAKILFEKQEREN